VLAVADDALLGTAAIERPAFLRACADRHPGRIGVSLDLRDGRPAVDGWLRTATADAAELARQLVDAGANRLIVTDTSRDGTLAGPNLALLTTLRAALPDATLVAAGGIGSLDDLRAVAGIGCDGAVIGMALLSGAIDPAEAVAVLEVLV
jgi:phosphoribosylformimino-5-aminoimidazole carboxamide ribotide isomerase